MRTSYCLIPHHRRMTAVYANRAPKCYPRRHHDLHQVAVADEINPKTCRQNRTAILWLPASTADSGQRVSAGTSVKPQFRRATYNQSAVDGRHRAASPPARALPCHPATNAPTIMAAVVVLAGQPVSGEYPGKRSALMCDVLWLIPPDRSLAHAGDPAFWRCFRSRRGRNRTQPRLDNQLNALVHRCNPCSGKG